NCGVEIDVNELLYQELETKAKAEMSAQINTERKKLAEKTTAIETQAQQLETTISERLNHALATEKASLEAKLKSQLEDQQGGLIKGLQTQLQEQATKLTGFNQAQLEIEKLKHEKTTLKSEIELDLQRKMAAQLQTEQAAFKAKTQEEMSLRVSEKEQVINQLRDQLNIAQRKAEQGSTQLQGEVQELVIEDWLRQEFPQDLIEEIKKGQTGADTLQLVKGAIQDASGSIYYESKRTKAFSPAWIPKFKADIQQKNADIGVLITQTMPDGMEGLGQIDGVWVCSFSQFKHLSRVLRDSLIQVSNALMVSDNKGDKMGMLYDFLTGNEFRLQIESIVEGFTELKSDLEREKRAMQGAWKRREKQLDRVLLNTNYMYNSIKGIAGSAVQDIAALELQDEEDN
ncbi:MAG TPA: DUF2130 domain-containing protein, partial [Gammaproteobacteria bacterium]|nr:DUF2130 domain-containing protein [Gammaproteobacteria bacterium]